MTEEEKLEHEILRYLNTNIEEFNITDEVLNGQFLSTPTYKYKKAISSLEDKKCIGHKDNNEKGWTITREGQKELNDKTLLEEHPIDIFISHSSEDGGIAEALINLIRKAYNLSAGRIRCTSVEGYKLPIGASTEDRLKKEIFSSKVFIGVITRRSVTSTYVLFELGARWGTTCPLLPLVCDPIGTSLLDGPLKNINALKTTDPSDIHQFIYDLGRHLDIKPENTNSYLKEIETLKELSSNGEKVEVEDSKPTEATIRPVEENFEAIIKSQSLIEWPENYEMQLDHIDRQREAVKKLKEGKPKDLTDEEFDRIRSRAKNEWPLNYEMRVDQEERQIESLRRLKKM